MLAYQPDARMRAADVCREKHVALRRQLARTAVVGHFPHIPSRHVCVTPLSNVACFGRSLGMDDNVVNRTFFLTSATDWCGAASPSEGPWGDSC